MAPEESRGLAPAPEMPSVPSLPSPESPEQAPAPEAAPERERSAQRAREAVAEIVAPGAAAAPAAPAAPKDEYRRRVESVMEEGLADVYGKLTPSQQEEFRSLGEETASKIRTMLSDTKVKVSAVLLLLRKWLLLIPGVNRLFLEQESKIKTDRLMKIAAEIRAAREKQP